MKSNSNRRTVLKNMAAGAGVMSLPLTLTNVFAASEKTLGSKLNGKINHSVCRWCYSKIPLETLALEAKKMGITSIELCGPEEWPILKKTD